MTDLDVVVQDVLHDIHLTPTERVAKAVMLIETFVRNEELVPIEIPLYVPVEWEHKVPPSAPEPPIALPQDFEVVDMASGVVIFKTTRKWWQLW